jgi:hypothetical protein
MSRNALIAILCGLLLAAALGPATAQAAGTHQVAISLGDGRTVETTGTFTGPTTLVVSASGFDLGSWSKVDGLQVTVKPVGYGEVVTYRIVDAWPSAAPRSKTLTFTLSTTQP